MLPLLLLAACSAAGCRTAERGESGMVFSQQPGTAYVYDCGLDARFVVRPLGDSVRVQRDLYSAVLPRVPAASGERYERDGRLFWSRGSEARFDTPDGSFAGCRGVFAESPWQVSHLLGYDFRAVGQEPGWVVEIDHDRRMHVLADYGEIDFYTAAPRVEAGREGERVHRGASDRGEVVVTVREQSCEDVMSGEPFPRAVTLSFAGRRLNGCGRALPAPASGTGSGPPP